MSRVMVCGGAGFVGSHLVERLLADGHDVDVVDDGHGLLIDTISCTIVYPAPPDIHHHCTELLPCHTPPPAGVSWVLTDYSAPS